MYYHVSDLIERTALRTGLIKSVLHGNLQDVDVKRQTIFPLMQVVPQNFSNDGKTIAYTFTLYILDLIDFNKKDLRDEAEPFRGTDNLIDVFHNTSYAASLFLDYLKREPADPYHEIGNVNGGQFVSNRFENLLAGVELQMTITVANTSTLDGIC